MQRTVRLILLLGGLVPSVALAQESRAASLFARRAVLTGAAMGLPPARVITREEDRDFWNDLEEGVVGFGKDAVDFVTAPFHLDGRQWIEVGIVSGAGLLVALFDQQIHDFVIDTQDQGPWSTILEVGDFFEPIGLMSNTSPWWLLGIGVSYAARWDHGQLMFEHLLYSHLISSATMAVPRTLIGRVRPRNSPDDPYRFRPFEGTSFPSGHASTIFEVARGFSRAIDWWPATALLYGMAGTVAYQRMAEEVDRDGVVLKGAPHWPSDVWFGAWYGIAAINIVIRNDEAEANPRMDTGIDPTGALRVSVRYRF